MWTKDRYENHEELRRVVLRSVWRQKGETINEIRFQNA